MKGFKLTCFCICEQEVLLCAGDGLQHHLEVLHIVGQGTLQG